MSRASLALLLPLLAHAAQGAAQVAEPDAVVIEAPKDRAQLEQQVHEYVASALLQGFDESVARWLVPACPFVAGLSPARNRFVAKRIVQVAAAAGVPVAPDGCAPNLLVIASGDPEGFLREWWHRDHMLFNTARGVAGIEQFIMAPRPVRTWYNAMSGCPGGSGTFRARGGTFHSECTGNGHMGSRLQWETVRTLYSAIVVIDLARVGELSMGQISDFVAMSALARLREGAAGIGAPSVLQLFAFDKVAKPEGLTRWDEAFLQALYGTRVTHTTQLPELRARMVGLLAR